MKLLRDTFISDKHKWKMEETQPLRDNQGRKITENKLQERSAKIQNKEQET